MEQDECGGEQTRMRLVISTHLGKAQNTSAEPLILFGMVPVGRNKL
jgi:hypothetical protein